MSNYPLVVNRNYLRKAIYLKAQSDNVMKVVIGVEHQTIRDGKVHARAYAYEEKDEHVNGGYRWQLITETNHDPFEFLTDPGVAKLLDQLPMEPAELLIDANLKEVITLSDRSYRIEYQED